MARVGGRRLSALAGPRYAIGALLAGLTADAFGLNVAMWVIAALTFVSGVVSATRMTETLPVTVRHGYARRWRVRSLTMHRRSTLDRHRTE